MSWKKKSTQDIGYDESDPVVIRGSLYPEDLVRRQIDRCNRSASIDYEAFSRNVEILALNLPTSQLEELDEIKDEYTTKDTVPRFIYVCGFPVGTVEHPKKNRFGDIVSPIMEETEDIDYYKLYRIVLGLLQDAGLSWKVEQRMVDGGRIDKNEEKYGPPTPTFAKDLKHPEAIISDPELLAQIEKLKAKEDKDDVETPEEIEDDDDDGDEALDLSRDEDVEEDK